MHFQIMVEDLSGKEMLEALMPNILLESDNTFEIKAYKGLGRLPNDLRTTKDPKKRQLLNQIPRLIRGYGSLPKTYRFVLIFVVDLDTRDCIDFKKEMVDIYEKVSPKPETRFRIAIEEMEAWLLGDPDAVLSAYPTGKKSLIESYKPDSIRGTWEYLADCIYDGGSRKLVENGYPMVGKIKSDWARRITPYIDIDRNRSHSFRVFIDTIRRYMD